MNDDSYWLGFSAFPGIGPIRFRSLLGTFETAKNAWNASQKDMEAVIGRAVTLRFFVFKRTFSLSAFAKKLNDEHIAYILLKNPEYPHLLHQLPTAPFVLYIKGNKELVYESKKNLAVVGTRKCTSYGKEVTEQIVTELVTQNFTIVSGLAIGIDSIAHQTTIDHGGMTIAVLGCGVDCCTPVSNQQLYDMIIRHSGAIVSESAFGGGAIKGIFPARNRIIAALSLGVVVTEGAEDSGALITAQRALELKRPVFAVPGPITSQLSKGPHYLIRMGATVVTGVNDIQQHLGLDRIAYNRKTLPIGENEVEQIIIELLAQESLYFDVIVRRSLKEPSIIAGTLSMMEVKGTVKSLGEDKFVLC